VSDDALISEEKRDQSGRFIVPPKSPGRPKGARNELGAKFIEALRDSFDRRGAEVIEEVIDKNPVQYFRGLIAILPKEVSVKIDELDELTDEQIERRLRIASAALAERGVDIFSGASAQAGAEQAGGVPTVQ
jgi:hypothetical protein